MTTTNGRSPRLFRMMAASFGVLLAVLLFFGAEWLLGRVDPPPAKHATEERGNAFAPDYQDWAEGPCLRVDGDRLLPILPPGAPPESGRALERVKPAGVARIAIIGESTGEMLQRRLAELVEQGSCGARIEVLRCAVSGSQPSLAVRRAEEVLAYSPDAIVVAIGHNFMLPAPRSQLQIDADRSRLAHEVGKLLPSGAGADPPARDPSRMGREAYQAIFQRTKAKGVPVVALLLGSNAWFRPSAEPGYLASTERMDAWWKWAQGDLAGANAALAPPATGDGALRAYERARFHAEASEWKEAAHDLEAARDLDPLPVRASSSVAHAIAEAVREGGAQVIDVAAMYTEGADHGLAGWDVFFDNCHPHDVPLDRLARAVMSAAAPSAATECLAKAPPPGAEGALSLEDAYDRLSRGPRSVLFPGDTSGMGYAAHPDNGAWRRLLDGPVNGVLRLAPRDAQAIFERFERERLAPMPPEVRAISLHAAAAIARDAGRLDLARALLDRSIAIAPAAPALVDRALLHVRAKEFAAARTDLEQALRLDAKNEPARRYLSALPRK